MTKLAGVVRLLKTEHGRLTRELKAISSALSAFGATYTGRNIGTRRMSAAGRANIVAAQKARWAKARSNGSKTNVVAMPTKRRMSVAARKKIGAAQRARWAKAKAAKKST
jgi:hypothetical protein